jgi:hypothetical protein
MDGLACVTIIMCYNYTCYVAVHYLLDERIKKGKEE